MKHQKGLFIKFPNDGYDVNVRDSNGIQFTMDATGFYLTWRRVGKRVYMDYTGDQTQNCYTKIEMPLNSDFLKEMASKLNELAERLESGDL
ncbi:hypothetical protein [Providencia stuartii]|uniref:hypothetical protein n=1 Tax=Providencia stuartii TaxID=588 RepID=UPI00111FFE94|nr:hypothetical protein [Providencia stuartii]